MPRTVLLVEPDAADRQEYGRWLEEAGFEVSLCPGPREPHYECFGDRAGTCPLAGAADVVVVDAELDSEIAHQGTTARRLVQLYRDLGTRVVVLSAWPDPSIPSEASILRRPPRREELLAAVMHGTG